MSNLRQEFTENAKQFDLLMVEMLTRNKQLEEDKKSLIEALQNLLHEHIVLLSMNLRKYEIDGENSVYSARSELKKHRLANNEVL